MSLVIFPTTNLFQLRNSLMGMFLVICGMTVLRLMRYDECGFSGAVRYLSLSRLVLSAFGLVIRMCDGTVELLSICFGDISGQGVSALY